MRMPWTKKKEPRFNNKRPIADQIVESILETPEEWEVRGTRTHRHRSGLRILTGFGMGQVEFLSPNVTFGKEDRQRIYKAIKLDRAAKTERAKKAAEKKVVRQLNNSWDVWDVILVSLFSAGATAFMGFVISIAYEVANQ